MIKTDLKNENENENSLLHIHKTELSHTEILKKRIPKSVSLFGA